MKSPERALAVLLLMVLGQSGCQHYGPRSILLDRMDYNDAVVTSWKQQTLLNIVRLRYVDTPEFIDVPSVVGGFENARTMSGSFGTEVHPHDSIANVLNLGLGGSRSMNDRPTITYSPQTGAEFITNLTRPIPAAMILNLIESGAPADLIMELAVESINGVRNRQIFGDIQPADPEFQQVIQIIRKAQASGHVSMRVKTGTDKQQPDLLMIIKDEDIPPPAVEELGQLRRLLRLDPTVHEFKLAFGMLPEGKDEIAIRTRSMFRIMTFLSINVQVPECHLAEGRAPAFIEGEPMMQPPLTVFSGCEKPCESFAAVQYRGYWFWIDDRDLNSKRSMIYLKILLALANTGQKDASPALTIRAN